MSFRYSVTLIFLILLFGCSKNTKHLAKGCYARIPIEFVGDNALVKVEIEGKKYPVKLDLGAACQFAFFKEALDALSEKKFVELITTIDLKGNQYKVNSYSVPCIKAKNLECKDAIVLEESRDFVTQGAMLWQSNEKKGSQIPFIGRMGRDCFKSHDLFIDFPNSMMFVTSNVDQLKMDHWPICDLFEIPFEMGRWGIILSIETDVGIKRMILDTGANASILRKSQLEITKEIAPGRQIFTTKKFAIGGHDFGPLDLSLFEMTPSLDDDGLLGLDFLKKYAVYLDFKSNKVFIGPSSGICGAIQGPKVIRIPLKFSSEFPIMKVDIEGKTHDLILDLGSACEFALQRDVLKRISKKERLDTYTTIDLKGQEHTASKYLLQRIKMQNSEVIHTAVAEDEDLVQDGISGRMGRDVLQTCNLLLDFPHSFLFMVKHFKDLKSENYSIRDFREVPFMFTRWGAVFAIETDFGMKRFFINTSAPFSGIRNLQEKVKTSKFKIGDVDLGSIDLDVVNINSSLNDVDGYLGGDFLKKHIVFLDFQKGKAFICPVNKSKAI